MSYLKLLKRNIYIYLALYVLITIIFAVLVWGQYNSKLNTAHSVNKAELSHMTLEIDNAFISAEMMTTQLSTAMALEPIVYFGTSSNILDYQHLQDNLAVRELSNPQYGSLYVYFFNSSSVLTASSYYTIDEFYDDQIIDSVLEIPKSVWYDYRYTKPDGVPVVSLVRYYPLVSTVPTTAVVVNFPAESLISNPVAQLISDNAFAITYGDAVYAKHGFDDAELDTSLLVGDDITTQGEYFIYHQQSGVTDLSYHFAVLQDSILQPIHSSLIYYLPLYILSICLTTVLLLLLSRYLVRRYYKITLKLASYFKNISLDYKQYDNYTMLDSAVDKMMSQNMNLEYTIEEYKPFVREHLVIGYVLGYNFAAADTGEQYKYLDLVFPHPFFSCFLIDAYSIDEQNSAQKQNDYLFYIKSVATQLFETVAVTYTVILYGQRIACLLNYPITIDIQNEVQPIATMLKEKIKNELGIGVTTAMGSFDESVEDINRSYLNACVSINQKHTDNIVIASDIKQSDTQFNYPLSLQNKLIMQMKNEREFDVPLFTKDFFLSFDADVQFKVLQNHTVFLVSNIAVALIPDGLVLTNNTVSEYVDRVLQCNSNTELHDELTRLIIDIYSLYQNESAVQMSEAKQYITQTVRYIKQNYNQNISLADIAEHVHLNPRYLGRIFKTAKGTTLITYVNTLRLKEAKELLKTTDMSVAAISEKLGYTDTRAFIRYFKKSENVTPSDFRHKYK